jgi:uncharacterized membrane protein
VAEGTQRRVRLDTPLESRRSVRPHYDPDAFGRLSERIARFLGTARFLVYMTAFIILWIGINVTPLAFDPYTFTFLTLLLSLQASYAAPLILLAQNRQADRDRVSMEEDRSANARLQADVDYLTREVAALRQSLGEVATRDFLRDQLRELTEEVVSRSRLQEEPDEVSGGHERALSRKREERERRSERKKRRAGQRVEETVPSLGEPFVGEDEQG